MTLAQVDDGIGRKYCQGMSCVPQNHPLKFYPQYLRTWLLLEIGPLKRESRLLG